MKRLFILLTICATILMLSSCKTTEDGSSVAATTRPVYDFTSRLCAGTDITVTLLITENISCLHDYTLQVSQMKAAEQSDCIVVSGAGLEVFMDDILENKNVIDASDNIALSCNHHDGESHDHNHDVDPHIWLNPENAKIMAENICNGLSAQYPQHAAVIKQNLTQLHAELDALQTYGDQALSALTCRELLTFHDGFHYLATAFELSILHAIEEESGREASAAELIELSELVNEHKLPAVFTELNGSTSASEIISRETGVCIFQLDMAMGNHSYFDAMYHNIDTLKEALE